MTEPREIDLARTEACVTALLRTLRPVLARHPHGPDNVLVALNALAFALLPVIAGSDGRALEFFRRALAQNLAGNGFPVPAWLSGELDAALRQLVAALDAAGPLAGLDDDLCRAALANARAMLAPG